MLNLTPHPIVIRQPTGTDMTIPPSGTVARVATTERVLDQDAALPCPVIARAMGEPEGLPEPGTLAIVSAMVLAACPGRPGLYAPDTGPTAIRDDQGRIIAVTRLVQA